MPKMLVIGPGPGPKNVLAELDDGTLVVVPYAIWKYKLKGTMADKTYVSVVGFVQFDVQEREAADQQVREFSVKPQGEPTKLIRVTLWPEFAHAAVEKGDFVAAEGAFTRDTYTANDGTKKTSLQISANKLNVNGQRFNPADDGERKVASSSDSEESDLF